MKQEELLQTVIAKILAKITGFSVAAVHPRPVPIGVSNRHIHLSQNDLETLFGAGYQLKPWRDLSQPGQFAAAETIIIGGPKGCIDRVRVLGPVRKQTQVEISRNDGYQLGINPPLRESGNLAGSAAVTVIGPRGSVQLKEGLIIAQRHIHMTPADAAQYGLADGATVQVRLGGERSLVFDRVVVRVNDQFKLEFHLDLDEANAAALEQTDSAYLINCNSIVLPKGQETGKPKNNSMSGEPLALVTEEAVRSAWKHKRILLVKDGGMMTPLARDTIKELGVEVVYQ